MFIALPLAAIAVIVIVAAVVASMRRRNWTRLRNQLVVAIICPHCHTVFYHWCPVKRG
jgi:hypothetical protein